MRRLLKQLAISVTSFTLIVLAATPVSAASENWEIATLVSKSTGGSYVNDKSYFNQDMAVHSYSTDGNYIVFSSLASDLTSDTDNNSGAGDVYLYSRSTDTVSLVSKAVDGTGTGNGESLAPAISGDGRYIVYRSAATDLVADNDLNGTNEDIFLYDQNTGITSLVSHNLTNTGSANQPSTYPVISTDGSTIGFRSNATDLTTDNYSSGEGQFFVYDVASGTITLISKSTNGTDASNGDNDDFTLSADGSILAFRSTANDLTMDTDTNGKYDIFTYDRNTSTMTLITKNLTGNDAGNDESLHPNMTDDASKIIFYSIASDIVAGDVNNSSDAIIYESATESLSIVSRNEDGTQIGDGLTSMVGELPWISPDGKYIGWPVLETDEDTYYYIHSYVRNMLTGAVTQLPSYSSGPYHFTMVSGYISSTNELLYITTGMNPLGIADENSINASTQAGNEQLYLMQLASEDDDTDGANNSGSNSTNSSGQQAESLAETGGNLATTKLVALLLIAFGLCLCSRASKLHLSQYYKKYSKMV